MQIVLDSPALTLILRVLALALSALVVVVAFTGPHDIPANLAPWAFYIQFWVGLVFASLVLGPVWRRVNPLRSISWLLSRASGDAPGAAALPRLGYWPAVVALLSYVYLELAFPGRSPPAIVGMYVVVYAIVQLAAALWYGAGWFARGDAFEVYSTLVGRLSPLGRRDDGVLVVRNPLDGAADEAYAVGVYSAATAIDSWTASAVRRPRASRRRAQNVARALPAGMVDPRRDRLRSGLFHYLWPATSTGTVPLFPCPRRHPFQ